MVSIFVSERVPHVWHSMKKEDDLKPFVSLSKVKKNLLATSYPFITLYVRLNISVVAQ